MAFDKNKNVMRWSEGYPDAESRAAFVRELREYGKSKNQHKSKENQAAEMRKTAGLKMI